MSQEASTYRRPQGITEHFVELGFVLIGLGLKGVLVVMRLFGRGSWLVLRAFLRALVTRRKAGKEEGAPDVEALKSAETSKPEKVEMAKVVPAAAVSKAPVSAAFTRTITFEKGFGAILFWFYPGGKVRRLVKIYDRALIERVGFERHEMEAVSCSGMSDVESILKATVAQVNALLRGKHEVKLRVVASGSPESVAPAKIDVTDAQISAKAEARTSSEEPAKRTKKEQGDVAIMPSSFKEAVEKKRSKPSKIYTGRIVEFGVKPRTIDKKEIEQYCVVIEAEELHGNELPVFGTDLERAIGDCGAEVGSRVRIEHLGRIEWTEPNGRKAWKNAYNVVLL